MLVATGLLLAGCSTLSAVNPVNWWHRQEGGKIAEQRPPPPGADQPYPNLSTVPSRPAPPDAEALKKLTASLIADRTNAQHAAQAAPLADPSSPVTSPSLFGVGTIPPPPPATGSASAPTASATMPAVNAPPPPPTASPPAASPRKPVQSAPLAPPSEQRPSAAQAPATLQPDLPSGPPARPSAAGAAPPAPPEAPAAMPTAASGPSATIVFLDGTSTLSPPATEEVKAFAAKRGKGTIAVTGFGDASASDPDVQATAVHLGLLRALAIAETLKSAGVPDNAIHVGAEAAGRGAALRLIQ